MQALLSRSPLTTLSMSSSQRPTRRRSARHAFEDESEAPAPVKRSRTETNGTGAATTNGNANGRMAPPPKKAAKTYEEADDDFVFSRGAKAKRGRGKKAEEKIEGKAVEEERVEKAVPLRRKKETQTTREEGKEEIQKRRRSARLSGDKEDVEVPQPEPVRAPKRAKKTTARLETKTPGMEDDMELVGRRTPVAQELQVEKRRDGAGTKIALPFADTPIIRKNKEMRKGSGQGHRRSSTGLRGRRASSLIESGQSNGETTSTSVRGGEASSLSSL
jgi:kinetochore protein Mis13/DSN1